MKRQYSPYPDRTSTQRAFGAHVSAGKLEAMSRFGVELVMGPREGPTFSDAFSDRSWYNCHSNGGVFNLGHRPPELVATLQEALTTLDIGNHHLVSGYRAKLAETLAATTAGQLPGVVYGVSGGEAADLAMKVVRGATGRSRIISVKGGFHGHTGLALAAGDPQYRDPFGWTLPDFTQVPFDDLEALEAAMSDQVAGVILETIPATLGIAIPSPGYLLGVQKLCRRFGAKLILDEVQTGLGRTGRMWAYQYEDGLQPDALITGKGLSGGVYPITATLLNAELYGFLNHHSFAHISTFGGSELGCAVALKLLEILQRPGFMARVMDQAAAYREAFRDLPFILRQRGLMMGFKFPVEGAGMFAAKQLYDAGVFVVYANNDTSVTQFLPPLNADDKTVAAIAAAVRGAFS